MTSRIPGPDRNGIPERIVAEVTRNWPSDDPNNKLISQRFEGVIAVNVQLGYELESWRMSHTFVPPVGGFAPGIVETIVAVFKRV